MSSKFSTTAGTHKVVPWCKKAPIPPVPPIGPYPVSINAQVTFYACLPDGSPVTRTFYFPNVPVVGRFAHGDQLHGPDEAQLYITYDLANPSKITAGADLLTNGLPVATLQDTAVVLQKPRPLEHTWTLFDGTLPAGQQGQIKVWE